MSQYFDKNFFKLCIGFIAILGISYMIVVAATLYQSESTQTAVKDPVATSTPVTSTRTVTQTNQHK